MSGIRNISDYRYGMDQAAEEFSRLKEQLLLDPRETRPNYRSFKAALGIVAADGGSSEHILKLLLDDKFYEHLSNLAQYLGNNNWRPLYIKAHDIELFQAFECSVRLLRQYSEDKEA